MALGIFRLACLSAVTAVVVGSGAPSDAQSLRETLALAYKNSDLLKQNRALLRATDEGAAAAVAALRPVVAFSGSANESDLTGFSTNLTLTASISVFDGGDSRLAIDVAKQNILATRSSLVNLEQQILLSAAQAFFDVRKTAEVVDLQKKNLVLIEKERDAAQDRFEVGEVTRTDVALAEAQLAFVRSSLAAAEGNYAVARESFRLAVGRYPTKIGDAGQLPRPAATLSAAQAIAARNSPDVQTAKHNAKVAELNVARAKTAFGPSVNLSGNLSKSTGSDINPSVTLSLNQTVYAGGTRSALYRQAVAQEQAAKVAVHYAAALAAQSVGSSWAQIEVAKASIESSQEQVRAARLAYEGLREEAQLGARTTLDVLNAEQNLFDAETNLATALNDQFISAYSLLAAMGKLTVKDLKLGIVTYDPAAYYESIKDAPRESGRGLKLDKVLQAIGKK